MSVHTLDILQNGVSADTHRAAWIGKNCVISKADRGQRGISSKFTTAQLSITGISWKQKKNTYSQNGCTFHVSREFEMKIYSSLCRNNGSRFSTANWAVPGPIKDADEIPA
jgi:hypothetical protein